MPFFYLKNRIPSPLPLTQPTSISPHSPHIEASLPPLNFHLQFIAAHLEYLIFAEEDKSVHVEELIMYPKPSDEPRLVTIFLSLEDEFDVGCIVHVLTRFWFPFSHERS